MATQTLIHCGYDASHPWYYIRGGAIPTLRQIKAEVVASGYRGYLAEQIETAARKPEPKRSEALKAIRVQITEQLWQDISCYRQVAHQLRRQRAKTTINQAQPACQDIHTAIGLKYAHIYNDFAILAYLDGLPNQQGDLFDLP